MTDSVSLTCPTCGGKLEISKDVERFACGYCGNEHIVRRSGGIITLKPVVEGLKEVKTGVDKTASELAITRLAAQLLDLISKRNANSSRSGCAWIWGTQAVLGFIFTFAFLGEDIGLIMGALLYAVVFFIITYFAISSETERINQTVPPIEKKILEVGQELEFHKNIVKANNNSSYNS